MTEDHRVASATERARIARTGQPLKDGEVRLSGMILCPVFGSSVLFFLLQLTVEVKSNKCLLFQQD
jgi:hypothetical protein